MKWLISYRYRVLFYYPDRHSSNEPADAIDIIDGHPAMFAAQFRRRAGGGPFPRDGEKMTRVDILERIYSAIEIPDGLLSEQDLELFT